MNKIKSWRWVSIFIYLIVMALAYYIYFGVGMLPSYTPLKWEGLETVVPETFDVDIYENNGWKVYSLKKIFVIIKIGIKPAFNIIALPNYRKKIMFKSVSGDFKVLFLAKKRKQFEVVYAETIKNKSVYFSAESGSVYAAIYMIKKMINNATYKGIKLSPPEISIPTGKYITDILFAAGIALPLLLILFIFYFFGKEPNSKYFIGDPVSYNEKNVYFTKVKKFGKKKSFCYLVLTSSRFMAFVFGKPILEVNLSNEKAFIQIEGNQIVVLKDNFRYVFRSKNILQWKRYLSI